MCRSGYQKEVRSMRVSGCDESLELWLMTCIALGALSLGSTRSVVYDSGKAEAWKEAAPSKSRSAMPTIPLPDTNWSAARLWNQQAEERAKIHETWSKEWRQTE